MTNEGVPNQGRNEEGVSRWGEEEAERYAKIGHGMDGSLFLDPHLQALLGSKKLRGMRVLDIGSGTGPWSAWAAECGATEVVSVDINHGMLMKAMQTKIASVLKLVRADAQNLPLPSGEVLGERAFDVLMSINVGCALGNKAFAAHFQEAKRVATPGAKFIVTAPISLEHVFTTGEESINVQKRIDEGWEKSTEKDTYKKAKEVISGVGEDVLRATFILGTDGKPLVISKELGNDSLVMSGQPILRKIPGLCVENNFHTAEEYALAALGAGWEMENCTSKAFSQDKVRAYYNKIHGVNLGKTYTHHPPFLVLELRKPL